MQDNVKLEQEFSAMVAKLAKEGNDILKEMTPEQAHLMHMAIGVAGEAGELLDAIKKHVIYQKPLDVDNVIEEVGDIYFYLEGIHATVNFSRRMALEKNQEKLGLRYSTGTYSNEQAKERLDKNG
jgi:NTP pyrophosphatase (non-canonical NTP hydrolase)